jgi:hypothetical protein
MLPCVMRNGGNFQNWSRISIPTGACLIRCEYRRLAMKFLAMPFTKN